MNMFQKHQESSQTEGSSVIIPPWLAYFKRAPEMQVNLLDYLAAMPIEGLRPGTWSKIQAQFLHEMLERWVAPSLPDDLMATTGISPYLRQLVLPLLAQIAKGDTLTDKKSKRLWAQMEKQGDDLHYLFKAGDAKREYWSHVGAASHSIAGYYKYSYTLEACQFAADVVKQTGGNTKSFWTWVSAQMFQIFLEHLPDQQEVKAA